jgi:hypothetical protein
MTTFTVIRKSGKIVKFYGHGHSEYADHGEDIVCAAISAVSQQTALGVLEHLKVPAHVSINEDDGFLMLDLCEAHNGSDVSKQKLKVLVDSKRSELDTLLESMLLMLNQIKNEYPVFKSY